MVRNIKYLLLSVIITYSMPVFTQQDSLLKEISNIDISLNAPPDSSEDLYLNTVSFQSFYDILSPMGEWIQIPKGDLKDDLNDGSGQGYSSLYNPAEDEELLFIWRPAGVSSDWRPYTYGRWEFTDRGWLWVSAESWGWTTCHYGRWWHSGNFGWVWLPGYVWAPSWVRWRVTDDHIGWVPLSPKAQWNIETGITEVNYRYKNNDADWVFVQKTNFVNDLNSSSVINPGMNSSLIAKSTKITNIKAENDMVVNNGPDVKDIEKRTGKTIQKKSVNFTREHGSPQIGENSITVYKGDFKKNLVDKTGKPIVTDKPQKYVHARKIIKKRIQPRRPRRIIRRK